MSVMDVTSISDDMFIGASTNESPTLSFHCQLKLIMWKH
jgi:hypothetical protein